MSVGLVLITHQPLAADLVRVAAGIYGNCPARIETLEVENDAPRDRVLAAAQRLLVQLDEGDGVLILTDIYGATPANLALAACAQHPRCRVLSGVNLPMLLRAITYAGLDLDAVAEKALEGGRAGVRLCPAAGPED